MQPASVPTVLTPPGATHGATHGTPSGTPSGTPGRPAPTPPLADRLRWLRAFRDGLKRHHPTLCALASEEVGKTPFEAMVADILPLLASCRWHLRRAPGVLQPRRVRGGGILGLGTRVERHRVAAGRVLVIATWNYPVQLLGIQLVQALVAGNTVVVKPSERAPRTQGLLLEIATRACDGVPSMRGRLEVRAATREEGARVLASERFDHVVFTGSTAVGRTIAEVCAARLTPSTLELSGSDSAIVLADADARAAARAIFMGVVGNSGQTCMAPRRVLVARAAFPAFSAEFARLFAGSPRRTLVDADAARHTLAVARAAIDAGGSSIAGAVEPCDGRSMRPIAVVDCPVETDLFLGRHFGPAVAVRVLESTDDPIAEALSLHARAGQFLATSIWTRRPSVDLAARAERCGSGLVHFNSVLVPSAHPGVSIGGHGASGWGASRGEAGLVAMTREVFVTRTSAFMQPPLDEPTAKQQGILARLLSWPLRGESRSVPVAIPSSEAQESQSQRSTADSSASPQSQQFPTRAGNRPALESASTHA
jgi:aldehyde dehydrogenase (NAD+)